MTLCWLRGSWCFQGTVTHQIASYPRTRESLDKSLFLHLLGLTLLPLFVAFSSPWSVPFLACMSSWIMSGRTMPLSSRVDMVLCTSDRKKLTTELDINLMFSNCVQQTENTYCKWHSVHNANSYLHHTYPLHILLWRIRESKLCLSLLIKWCFINWSECV